MLDRRRFVAAAAAALAALSLAAIAGADGTWKVVSREWFVLSLAGEPCGSSATTVEESGGGEARIRTSSEVRMRLARGTTAVTVAIASEFVETARGEPVSAEVRQEFGGGAAVPVRYEFGPDGVTVREGERTRKEPRPDPAALPPAAASRFVKARLGAGAAEIAFRAIDVESGLRVASIRLGQLGEAKRTVRGREIPVREFSVTSDLLEVPGRETYASDGVLVESVIRLGIGELRSMLADEAEARAALRNARAEVLVRSFVPAGEPIRNARGRERLSLVVTAKEGGALPELPSAGAQRAERTGPGAFRVEIEAGRSSPASAEERADPAFLAATALIDHDAPAVRELLGRTLPRPGLAPRERAERLRRATGKALGRKDLESPFASASAAIRSGGGDCSEHAVALAALLRADGIPARIVGGLIYADAFAGEREVWGWHVWTQALLPDGKGEPAWFDLDATLPGTRAFDAAHLATVVGPLAGGSTDPMWSETLALLGNLEIRVLGPGEGGSPGDPR
jgi:hypothetical protein